MFVIPCKYNKEFPAIQQIVKDIRKFHSDETICVVDSDSDDKSYFDDIKKYKNIIIEDIGNKNYQIGAYWHGYKKYPNEEFYYFLHDSMIVKDNLDYLKEKDLTVFLYFDRKLCDNIEEWSDRINNETKYLYNHNGLGVFGPIYFCKNKVMKEMMSMGVDKLLPFGNWMAKHGLSSQAKQECGWCEVSYGFFFEEQGYNLRECCMYQPGDVFDSINRFSDGPNYSNSERASKRFYPLEKYIMALVDKKRG